MSINDGVASGVSNWRIWGMGSLNVAPVFTAPLTDGQTLVCYTVNSTQKVPKVARIDAQDQLVEIYSLTAGLECRGSGALARIEFLLTDMIPPEMNYGAPS
jgi:hypothetical protein